MGDMLRSGEPIIDDNSPTSMVWGGVTGCIPRDYDAMPVREYGVVEMPLLGMDEIKNRAVRMAAEERRLSDLYLAAGWENLDQGSDGYCWQYGPTHALMVLREVQGLPRVRLAAHCPAAVAKGGRNQGAWGALGMEMLMQMGAPIIGTYPEHSRNLRDVTEAVKAEAMKYRLTEGWWDAAAPVYNRDLSWQQVLTLLVCGVPVVGDFDWWGHCVCLLDVVVMPDGSLGVRILNSWKGWGMRGLAVLSGGRARPNNAVAPRVATAA